MAGGHFARAILPLRQGMPLINWLHHAAHFTAQAVAILVPIEEILIIITAC